MFFIGDAEASGFSSGILSGSRFGIIFGIGAFALIRVISLRQATRDDKKLRELYNKEHDERLIAIRAKSGMPLLLISSDLMLIAAMIAGPINITIFYTLLIASTAQLLTCIAVKTYFLKKM